MNVDHFPPDLSGQRSSDLSLPLQAILSYLLPFANSSLKEMFLISILQFLFRTSFSLLLFPLSVSLFSFRGCKSTNSFLNHQIFFHLFKKIFFSLSSTPHSYNTNSKNGRAKIQRVLVFYKSFLITFLFFWQTLCIQGS